MTRTAAARYLAQHLGAHRPEAVRKTAAWLIKTGQASRASELVRETERLLEAEGYLYAEVTSAHPLTPRVKDHIARWLKTELAVTEVEIGEVVNPEAVGGLVVQTPTKRLDSSLSAQLQRLLRENSL